MFTGIAVIHMQPDVSCDTVIKADEPVVTTTVTTSAEPVMYTVSTEKLKPIVTEAVTTVPATSVLTTTTPVMTTVPVEVVETVVETPVTDDISYPYHDSWLWIGDSRTVGMSQFVSITRFAECGMGLNWFLENAETIYEYRDQTIVINLGVNDLGNVYNYLNTFRNMPEEFVQSNYIYIMSVNPVDEVKERQYGYIVSNAAIENFNSIIRDNLRDDFYFIDTYSYLINDGFSTVDGLHYDGNTYIKIHDFMIDTIMG